MPALNVLHSCFSNRSPFLPLNHHFPVKSCKSQHFERTNEYGRPPGHIARAFDPQTQAAHDQSRQARLLKSMQLLAVQLHDHEVEIRQFWEKLYEMQWELDQDSRCADKAEIEVCILE